MQTLKMVLIIKVRKKFRKKYLRKELINTREIEYDHRI
jgi:hypothetical protein